MIERDKEVKTAQLLACRNKAEKDRKSFQETVDKLMSSNEVCKLAVMLPFHLIKQN